MIDLHLHTIHSDGQYTPEEIVGIAAKRNLTTIAITDHDSVAGVEAALAEGKKKNIEVITGIEITAIEDKEVHILGYGIDLKSKVLNEFLMNVDKKIEIEEKLMFEHLNEVGVNISKDDVYKYKEGRLTTVWHFAKALVSKGYENSVEEAIVKFFPANFRKNIKNRVGVEEAINIIIEAGGIAVLAHPKRLRLPREELECRIDFCIEKGLKGIEAVYSLNSDEETKYFEELAKRKNLVTTIGSDFHGENIKGTIEIGTGVDDDMVRYQVDEFRLK